jgi:soluble lytic murein transglycosylase-like protein
LVPLDKMKIFAKSLMAILLTGLVLGSGLALSCAPASAQIVSVLDEHGQRVYINTAPPPPRVTASSKNSAAGSNATKGDQVASGLSGASPALSAAGGSQSAASGASNKLSSARLEELVQSTAARHGVDANLVRAVIETESGGNPSAVSRKGAVGLMQLMPTTALELGVKNMYSASENLEAGVRYLHTLIDRYGGDLDKALAAYNAGAGAVDRAGGVPHYRETVDYVKKVTNNYFAADAGKPTGGLSAPHSGIVGPPASSAANTTMKATTPAASKAPVVVPPPNKMYKTTDASGHVVWAN